MDNYHAEHILREQSIGEIRGLRRLGLITEYEIKELREKVEQTK